MATYWRRWGSAARMDCFFCRDFRLTSPKTGGESSALPDRPRLEQRSRLRASRCMEYDWEATPFSGRRFAPGATCIISGEMRHRPGRPPLDGLCCKCIYHEAVASFRSSRRRRCASAPINPENRRGGSGLARGSFAAGMARIAGTGAAGVAGALPARAGFHPRRFRRNRPTGGRYAAIGVGTFLRNVRPHRPHRTRGRQWDHGYGRLGEPSLPRTKPSRSSSARNRQLEPSTHPKPIRPKLRSFAHFDRFSALRSRKSTGQ